MRWMRGLGGDASRVTYTRARLMERFLQNRVYTWAQVIDGIGKHELDAPFVIGETKVALVATLGEDPGSPHLPSRTSLRWPQEAPRRVTERGVSTLLFIEEGADELRFLGAGSVTQFASGTGRVRDVHFSFRPSLPRDRWLAMIPARIASHAPPFPEQEIMRLSDASSFDECWGALEMFVQRWYGATPRVTRARERRRAGPALLHRVLDLAGQVRPLFKQNHLVRADELVVDDGRVTFLVENQGVCLWATEPEGDDPLVWYRNNDEGEPWIEEAVPLSRFLVQAVLLEAVLGASFGGSTTGIPSSTLDAFRARLDPIGDRRWNWCGARFYARDGALAVVLEDTDLFLAGRSPHALTPLLDLVTDDWDVLAF